MANTFELRVVTPEGEVLQEDVEFVLVPGEDGELGFLPNHAPLIAGINTGVLRYNVNGGKKKIALSGGFVEVADNQATILADTAEKGEMIDLDRAIAAKDRAEKRLSLKAEETDIKRAEFALRRALARISAAEK
ncbi:MAG: F0F1 ATP synthase subunit epsilon [Desulfitobacteriaceae bacterium]|nr:F0F1 ATP synthase subunit epsilon [Desulfitobacteriaceae bacterium]MDD4345293.1 F0F1 ATP synthase subunit epsilon [Desulfitobacteriaceae bacterium]MDD4400476.1 F0F1 ATP synthase subunit epsilon [Desulfitobacteriaceae bacterium]